MGVAGEEEGTCLTKELSVEVVAGGPERELSPSPVAFASARIVRILRINWSVCWVPSMRHPTMDLRCLRASAETTSELKWEGYAISREVAYLIRRLSLDRQGKGRGKNLTMERRHRGW